MKYNAEHPSISPPQIVCLRQFSHHCFLYLETKKGEVSENGNTKGLHYFAEGAFRPANKKPTKNAIPEYVYFFFFKSRRINNNKKSEVSIDLKWLHVVWTG